MRSDTKNDSNEEEYGNEEQTGFDSGARLIEERLHARSFLRYWGRKRYRSPGREEREHAWTPHRKLTWSLEARIRGGFRPATVF